MNFLKDYSERVYAIFARSWPWVQSALFSKDFFITILGTFLGALLALLIALYMLGFKSESRSKAHLELAQQEIMLNYAFFQLIDESLEKWISDEIKMKPRYIKWRLSTIAMRKAAESEDVYNNVNPIVVVSIVGHLLKIQALNSEIDAFIKHIFFYPPTNPTNRGAIIKWAKGLKRDIIDNKADADNTFNYISRELGRNSQQERLRIKKQQKKEGNR